jgi:hypothetical protein
VYHAKPTIRAVPKAKIRISEFPSQDICPGRGNVSPSPLELASLISGFFLITRGYTTRQARPSSPPVVWSHFGTQKKFRIGTQSPNGTRSNTISVAFMFLLALRATYPSRPVLSRDLGHFDTTGPNQREPQISPNHSNESSFCNLDRAAGS